MTAKKYYNRIMYDICNDHLVIKTGEETENWNLRDMVSECQYNLDINMDEETTTGSRRYESEEEYKQWYSDVAKLQRFIYKYKNDIKNLKCYQNHCSKFDN